LHILLSKKKIVQETKPDEEKEMAEIAVEMIPSSFDRSIEPPKGAEPVLNHPSVWKGYLKNGLRIYGIEHHELPMIQFSITLEGEFLLDDMDKIGVANLMTKAMMEGTKNKTPVELREAIDELGANISMYRTAESIVIQANTLASKFDPVYALVEEILLEPRWDEIEFETRKRETIETINRRSAQPSTIATNVFNKLIYGKVHILSNSKLGTPESVGEITIEDLKKFYEKNYSPNVSHIAIVGDISKDKALTTFKSLEAKWPAKEVTFPEYPNPPAVKKSRLYFVDVPKAKQSEIRIGYLALAYTDPDYYPATVMNYKLGGGFSSTLNLILREEKGYTYGAGSGFNGTLYPGAFAASAAVKSNVTVESMKTFMEELTRYRMGISGEDLKFTKNALIKSNTRRFETLGALRSMLDKMATYNLPEDYIKKQEAVVQNMTVEQHKQLAEKYITPDKMIYLVVGDAETQSKRLRELGIGEIVLLDKDGIEIKKRTSM